MEMTIEQAWAWVDTNLHYITGSARFMGDDLAKFTAAYNAITGDNKKQTSCGRCIHSMKHALQAKLIQRYQ